MGKIHAAQPVVVKITATCLQYDELSYGRLFASLCCRRCWSSGHEIVVRDPTTTRFDFTV